MGAQPQSFTLHLPTADIEDVRERLARTRFPDQAPSPAWAYGADVTWMRGLVDYWRAQEARLNAFPQCKVPPHDIDLHFIHVPGEGPEPCPLLLSHGWPGSVFEFLELIPYIQKTKLKLRSVEHLSEDLLASNVLSIIHRKPPDPRRRS